MYGELLHNQQSMIKNSLEIICNILPRVGHMAIAVCGGSIILFLWFRQIVFYVDSAAEMINTKFAKLFSYFVLFFYVLCWCGESLAYLITVRYAATSYGVCIVEDENQGSSYTLIILSWMLLSILMQILLLGLFIYPIYLLRKHPDLQQNELITSNKLRNKVNKAAVLASTCVATDLLTIVILAIFNATSKY